MKILTLVLLFPLFGFIANEKLNECNGFEGFVFGTSKESYKSLNLEIEEGNSQLYEAGSNAIHIEGVQFDFIRITFTNKQLSAIALSTKNATAAAFLKMLSSRYGTPLKVKKHFEWVGKNVRIVYEPYAGNKDAAIDFYKR